MTRLPTVDPTQATGKTRQLLDAVHKGLGFVPNMMRVFANSPAALEGYLNFTSALAGGVLDAKVREQIALTVAEANLCDYCLSAHTAIGAKVGLSPAAIESARKATSSATKTDAILKLARSIVVNRGEIADPELLAARQAGLSDAELVETIANVALNVLTNYTNHVARTVIDFPKVPSAAAGAAR